MKYINENYNKNIFEGIVRKKSAEKVIKAFSTYLVNYDKDYLYNYKFIKNHINDFFTCWKKSVKISKISERIRDIINSSLVLKKFMGSIKNNDISLSIIIDNAIKICWNKKKNNKGNIYKDNVPSLKTLKYDKGSEVKLIDINIKLQISNEEFIEKYKKISIKEITKKNNDKSIIEMLNNIIDEFANYFIKINNLEKIIEYLDNFDYENYNIKNIKFNFDNIFEYNPFKYTNENKRFSSNAFIFKKIKKKCEIISCYSNINANKTIITCNSSINSLTEFIELFKKYISKYSKETRVDK